MDEQPSSFGAGRSEYTGMLRVSTLHGYAVLGLEH